MRNKLLKKLIIGICLLCMLTFTNINSVFAETLNEDAIDTVKVEDEIDLSEESQVFEEQNIEKKEEVDETVIHTTNEDEMQDSNEMDSNRENQNENSDTTNSENLGSILGIIGTTAGGLEVQLGNLGTMSDLKVSINGVEISGDFITIVTPDNWDDETGSPVNIVIDGYKDWKDEEENIITIEYEDEDGNRNTIDGKYVHEKENESNNDKPISGNTGNSTSDSSNSGGYNGNQTSSNAINSSTSTSAAPKTGDDNNMIVYFSLMMISGGFIACIFDRLRRNKI